MVVNDMTLNKMFAKLRKYNKKNYYQLKFCIAFPVQHRSAGISPDRRDRSVCFVQHFGDHLHDGARGQIYEENEHHRCVK